MQIMPSPQVKKQQCSQIGLDLLLYDMLLCRRVYLTMAVDETACHRPVRSSG